MRAVSKWYSSPWLKPTALMVTLVTVLLAVTFLGEAVTPQLVVTPSLVSGSVNASRQAALEFAEGLHVYLSPVPGDQSICINLAMEPLVDRTTGSALPMDRLLLGVDTLPPMPATGQVQFPFSTQSPMKIRMGVQPKLFDPPGIYEGVLHLTVDGSVEVATAVRLQVEVLPWTAVRLVATPPVVVASQDQLESPTFMSSGEQRVIQVASNRRWQLVAQAPPVLLPQAGPSTSPVTADLRVRVLPNEWVQPMTAGFTRLTPDPTVVAVGKTTADCADGWVTVNLELRLPYERNQAAGAYTGELGLAVATY